jgi:restriction endonuclease Mrr
MAIPDFQSILLPLLKATASREELSSAESYKLMAEHFQLSEAEVENPDAIWQGKHLPQSGCMGKAVPDVRPAR